MKIERERKIIEKRFGGMGRLVSDSILTADQMSDACRMFSEITLEVGCSLGLHEHRGETETYFILEGKGLYYDNGSEYEVFAGDVLFCDNAQSHGMVNTGDTDLRFVALILKK